MLFFSWPLVSSPFAGSFLRLVLAIFEQGEKVFLRSEACCGSGARGGAGEMARVNQRFQPLGRFLL
jgi:hypothetical protein